jgi:hypothetical protein
MKELEPLIKLLVPYGLFTGDRVTSGDILTYTLLLIIIAYGIVSFIQFGIKTRGIKKNLENHTQKLSEFNAKVAEEFESIKELFYSNSLLKDEWQEYESTLIKRDNPHRVVYKTEPAETYFNESRILANRVNVRYWYALPGIFIGLGIFGTFIGLTFGLSTFGTGSTEEIQASIEGLLSGMTTAFTTSVWGMIFSIAFNFYEKVGFNGINSELNKLSNQIDKLFTLTTQEKIAFEQQDQLEQQTTALKAFSTDLADRIKVAMDSILASRLDSLQGVVERLYRTSEESTDIIIKEIRSFGGNITNELRDTIGSIMLEKLSPSLEQVSQSINNLVPIVENLRMEKQETSLAAIKNMVEEFKDILSSTTRTEMESLTHMIENAADSLSSFPSQLEAMIGMVQEQMTQMKILLEQTSSKTVEEAATATSLMREEAEKAVKTFGATIQNLQDNIAQLLERQASDARIVENLISNSQEVIQKGNLLTQNMTGAIDSINDAIRQISGVSRLFIDGANTLKESGQKLSESASRFALQNEQYIKANKETLDKITSSLKDSERLLKEFAEKFRVIENGLSGIFSRIQEGLDQYALKTRETLNNYLADFASYHAEAAQRLAGSIEALNETVENIEEILSNVKKQ